MLFEQPGPLSHFFVEHECLVVLGCCEEHSFVFASFITKGSPYTPATGQIFMQKTRAIDARTQFRPEKGCSEATKQREHACAGCKHKRAFFTAAKHNETTQTCQKSKIYTIATMVGPESHTRGGSSCYGARERSTSQRAGAPF